MLLKIDSLYICVEDMERAIKFYEEFFEQKVSEKGDIGSCFEIDGFRFNLFAYKVEITLVSKTNGINFAPSINLSSCHSAL